MEELFSKTPFNSSSDALSAIKSGFAKLTLNRSTAYNIGSRINRACSLTIWLGFFLATFIVIAFAIIFNNYWILIAIPFLFVLNYMAPYLKVLPFIAIVLSIPSIVFNWPMWVLVILISIVMTYIGYNIWWSITYNTVRSELLKDESLFIDVWKAGLIGIRDNKNNFYIYVPTK